MHHGQAAKLAKGLVDAGIQIIDAPVMPGETLQEWPVGEYIVYGSTRLVEDAFDQGRPGTFYSPRQFNVKTWIQNRQDMFNSDVVFMSTGNLREYCQELHRNILEEGQDRHMFFRPVHDLKPFNAKVLSPEDIADVDKYLFGNYQVEDDVEIAISEAHQIDAEVRLFIVGGEYVSGSYYRRYGEPFLENCDDTSLREEMIWLNKGQWLPHQNCVLDMAWSGGSWYALEFNCINASGFYDHDVAKVAKALSSQEWV
jgi:hypothetical protein